MLLCSISNLSSDKRKAVRRRAGGRWGDLKVGKSEGKKKRVLKKNEKENKNSRNPGGMKKKPLQKPPAQGPNYLTRDKKIVGPKFTWLGVDVECLHHPSANHRQNGKGLKQGGLHWTGGKVS